MSERNRRPLEWGDAQLQALQLVLEGRQTIAKIAENCGVPKRTLEDWLAHPEFQERLDYLRASTIAGLRKSGIPYIDKQQRLIALAQMAEQARQLFEADPYIVTVKPTQGGDIVERRFNTSAFNAFRTAIADIAEEIGARKDPICDISPEDAIHNQKNAIEQRERSRRSTAEMNKLLDALS